VGVAYFQNLGTGLVKFVRIVGPTTPPPPPQEIFLVLISVRG